MNLEELFNAWEQDSDFDELNLMSEVANIGRLYTKYYRLYSIEKLLQNEYEIKYKTLTKEKTEMFLYGASVEQKKQGWEIPQNKILKTDIPMYINADTQLNDLTTKLSVQTIKVNFLKDVLKQIEQRQFQIKTYMDALKLKLGNV